MMSFALITQFILCPLVFLGLIWVTAPYGRHFKHGWGPNLPNRTAWVLMEIPAVTTIAVLVLVSPQGKNLVALVPLSLWMLHYIYRTFLFPALMHPSNKTFPAVLVLFAIAFNLLNGFNNSEALLQNAISQAREFNQAIGLDGITVTKLDGTARGGVLFAIAHELKLPIRFIGVGEAANDLRPFDAGSYVNAILPIA